MREPRPDALQVDGCRKRVGVLVRRLPRLGNRPNLEYHGLGLHEGFHVPPLAVSPVHANPLVAELEEVHGRTRASRRHPRPNALR